MVYLWWLCQNFDDHHLNHPVLTLLCAAGYNIDTYEYGIYDIWYIVYNTLCSSCSSPAHPALHCWRRPSCRHLHRRCAGWDLDMWQDDYAHLTLYGLTCYTKDFFRFWLWLEDRPACSFLAWTRLAVGRVWKPSKCSCPSSTLSKPCLGRELSSSFSFFFLASRPWQGPWQGPCALHGSLELKPARKVQD